MSERQFITCDASSFRTVMIKSVLLLCLVSFSTGLRLTRLDTPSVADVREEMELRCEFDLGDDELYGVKWYKDHEEFFRYMPGAKFLQFPVSGVHIVPESPDCNDNHCNVKLHQLSRMNSGGAYTCEISGEAPKFRLVSNSHQVIVAALPRENPRIEGLTTSYAEGDTLAARCISAPSDPPPILTWYINGQLAPADSIDPPRSSQPDSLGLVSRSVNLLLPIEVDLSSDYSIELRCESVLPGIPLSPRAATYKLPLRNTNDPPEINNQKLHWYSFTSVASFSNTPGATVIISLLMFMYQYWIRIF